MNETLDKLVKIVRITGKQRLKHPNDSYKAKLAHLAQQNLWIELLQIAFDEETAFIRNRNP